jgi:uncharacterized membrane protein
MFSIAIKKQHVSLDYMFFILWLLMAMEEHVSLDYMFFILWLLMAMEEHVSLDYMFFMLWLLMAMEEHERTCSQEKHVLPWPLTTKE